MQRLLLSRILGALTRTGHDVTEIIVISAASGLVIAVPNITGDGFNLAGVRVPVPAGVFPGAVYSDLPGVMSGPGLMAVETSRARAAPA